jgi:murein tripeptide amidase MpaA
MIDTTHYYSNDEILNALSSWSTTYPSLMHLETIGHSFQGVPIQLCCLTNSDTGKDTDKPAVWVDANIHATELCGTTITLRFLESMLEGYGKEPQITRLMDTCTFYVLPRTNPDGAALALDEKNPRFLRSSTRPYPWEDKQEGLHVQDINGDGRILQMRIPDPNGNWKTNSQNPRLMEMRQPHEQGGEYFRILPEGMMDGFDGYLIRDARPYQSLDLNRNFPFDWHPESDQFGAGPFPVSEPEIRAVVDFVIKHPNINVAIAYHTFSRAILRPYSTRPDEEMEYNDLQIYKKIADIGTQITGYPAVNIYRDFRFHPKEMTYGAFDDWMFDLLGAFAYTIEIWDLPTAAGIENRKLIEWFYDHPVEQDLQIMKWVEDHYPQGYVDWFPYEHPQLGKIELGGWDGLFTWTNPPAFKLPEEVDAQVPYLYAIGEMLPLLHVHTLTCTQVEEGVWKINLVVENSGFLPTFTSHQAKKRANIRPVRVELDLPEGCTLASGKIRSEMGHLEGRSNKLDRVPVWISGQTDNRARLEWVVTGKIGDQITLHIKSERAGSLHRTVKLE